MEVFQNYSVIFLGYAFGDTELLDQIANAARNKNQEDTHFALLPQDGFPAQINEAVYETLFRIRVIKYGLKENFISIFGNWIDSNFPRPVSISTGEGDTMLGDV